MTENDAFDRIDTAVRVVFPETLCEPCFWCGVVGLEPFVIMNAECTTYLGEEIGVVTEGPRDCIFCRDCAGKVFSEPSRFKILDIRLYRRNGRCMQIVSV